MKIVDSLSTGWKAWIILLLLPMVAAAPGVFSLPSLDRDESRFAQASKQMLETGDYIRIQYQDELRNKKPAGIHWLQAGSTAVLGDENPTEIWTYRVPSWIGAGLAAMACFWCGILLIGRRAAFLGAAMFGSTMLLTSEAHISKTDGVLVFLTTLGIGALAHLYMKQDQSKRMALLFWFAVSASFLIKGPVTMLVVAFAGFGAWVWQKYDVGAGGNWWRPIAWWPGPALFVAMVLPWFIWIQTATNGAFFRGAVGKDLKDKFAGASEGHAGWPLYHLTHIPAWFFPATLLILPAVVLTWRALRGKRKGGNAANTRRLAGDRSRSRPCGICVFHPSGRAGHWRACLVPCFDYLVVWGPRLLNRLARASWTAHSKPNRRNPRITFHNCLGRANLYLLRSDANAAVSLCFTSLSSHGVALRVGSCEDCRRR